MNPIRHRSASMIARTTAIGFAALLALSACGSDGAAETTSDEPATAEAQPAETTETAGTAGESTTGESTADAASADATTVKVGEKFTDKETGDVVTIVSAVRHNPTEYYEATDNPDGEMVYLEVKVVPGKSYGGVISIQDFFIDSDGEDANYAGTAQEEVEAAGYEYFDRAPRRDGEHEGYIPIYVPKTADTLTGSYVRPEAKVIGEDKKVPEFTAEFEIPAS